MEINGVTYIERKPSSQKMPSGMARIMMMTMAMGIGSAYGEENKSNPVPRKEVNIIEEFELIQQKKSNLSKSQRNQVEYEFNKHFEIAELLTP